MALACQRLHKPEDNTSTARAWVNELKQMEPQQQLFAKKAINDILFERRMGTLNRHSVLINETPQSLVQHTFAEPQSTSSSRSATADSVVSQGSFENKQLIYDNLVFSQENSLASYFSTYCAH